MDLEFYPQTKVRWEELGKRPEGITPEEGR